MADVSVTYDGGARALSGVSLSIAAGEQLACVGPSGAGKTSLLRLLNGTLAPTGGRVEVDGVDLDGLAPPALRELRAHIGFVHQDHALVPNLRVSRNVLAGRLGQRGMLASLRSMIWPSRDDLLQAHAVLARVGIPEKLFERTDTLSGGQQQRVALARALFQEPLALLADEPVASVDPARARALVDLMCDVVSERDLTLVVSLHDLQLAREFFPRTVGLREGRVVFDARTAQLSDADFADLYALETAPSREP